MEYKDEWIRDQVLELYDWSKQDHERRFCRPSFIFYRHYKNWVEPRIDPDDYRRNMGIGIVFPTIELISAKLMEPWLSGDSLIKARGLGPDAEAASAKIGQFVNAMLVNRIDRSMSKLNLVKKSALILSRGVLKYYVRRNRPREILTRIPIRVGHDFQPGGMRMGSVLQWQSTTDPPAFDFDYVDPFGWWMTPGARFLHKSDWTFEDQYLTTSQVHERFESGEWDYKEVSDDDALGYDQYRMQRFQLEMNVMDQVVAGQGNRRPHAAFEFQGRIQVKDTKGSRPRYEDRCVQILNRKDLLQTSKLSTYNGRPSYICWEPVLDPCSDRAIGVIEPAEDMVVAIGDFANIIVDNLHKIVESSFALDPTSTDQRTLYLGPGEINLIRNPQMAVKALEMKDIPGSAFQFLGWFNDLFQRITGVSDFFGGLNTSDTDKLTKTATGMSLMASLSASRFGPILGSMDHDLYRLLAEAIFYTTRQRLDGAVTIRLPGQSAQPFATLEPEDFEFDQELTFNTKSLDPASAQNRAELLEMVDKLMELGEPLAMQGGRLDIYEVVRMIMDGFDRAGDVDRLIEKGMMPPAQPGMPGAQPGMPTLPGMPPGAPLPMVPEGSPMAGMGQMATPGRPQPPGLPPGNSPISPAIPGAASIQQLMAGKVGPPPEG